MKLTGLSLAPQLAFLDSPRISLTANLGEDGGVDGGDRGERAVIKPAMEGKIPVFSYSNMFAASVSTTTQ